MGTASVQSPACCNIGVSCGDAILLFAKEMLINHAHSAWVNGQQNCTGADGKRIKQTCHMIWYRKIVLGLEKKNRFIVISRLSHEWLVGDAAGTWQQNLQDSAH